MKKIKSMEIFQKDVKEGDLVRVLFPQSSELVGFFVNRREMANGYYAVDLARALPTSEPISTNKKNIESYVWSWESDEPNPIGYEVLRRKK